MGNMQNFKLVHVKNRRGLHSGFHGVELTTWVRDVQEWHPEAKHPTADTTPNP